MQHVHIRLALPAETPVIAAILRAAFEEFEPLYTPDAFRATTPTASQIQRRWDEGPVWIAAEGSRLIGTLAAVPTDQGLYLRSMAVHPDARTRGVGRALLDVAERFARAQSLRCLYLSTTPFLDRAILLYSRYGFERRDLGPTDLHGTPLFTMIKDLPPDDPLPPGAVRS